MIHKLKNIWYKIYRFFNPCHKEIRKCIPREWKDIDAVLEDVVWTGFKSWAENEDGLGEIEMIQKDLDKIDDPERMKTWGGKAAFLSYAQRLPDLLKLQECYDWVLRRKHEERRVFNLPMKKFGVEYDNFEKKDRDYIDTVWKFRGYFWS